MSYNRSPLNIIVVLASLISWTLVIRNQRQVCGSIRRRKKKICEGMLTERQMVLSWLQLLCNSSQRRCTFAVCLAPLLVDRWCWGLSSITLQKTKQTQK